VIHKGNTFNHVAGNTWTSYRCSDDRALDAGGSVTDAVPRLALFREICEQPWAKAIKDGKKFTVI